ncbi:hypothetical protein SAMN05192588_1800 [Nonlabens sp. Hel1_33_55]|uniref:hypothetical protein n=1 Tax=Nonlabens sp. Hel1_33_55 TaxID=1336802 RepID=UPI000875AC38|nr:hypothetical protein [Nonlabens sp. Hel1_33_55]SCY23406.1 hypothetical protein SAMN05192588_1800 [Nonlabens sp. Hel1_33_55]
MDKIRYANLGYAEVFIFENYVINQISDGVTVSFEHVEVMRKAIKKIYGDRKIVYISNRVGSYSVDPLIYPEISKIDNLVGIAIITDNIQHERNAEFEKNFYKKQFGVFQTLKECLIWTDRVLEYHEQNVETQ